MYLAFQLATAYILNEQLSKYRQPSVCACVIFEFLDNQKRAYNNI